jgi:hypothetical protein
MRHHLAVVYGSYLDLILAGRKRIECRVLRRWQAPLGQVAPGDHIWFKRRCGPIEATARVRRVAWYRLDGPAQLELIRRRFGPRICAEPDFWRSNRDGRYVGLIWLSRVRPCQPLTIRKSDRRSWVLLDGPPQPGQPIQQPPTPDGDTRAWRDASSEPGASAKL